MLALACTPCRKVHPLSTASHVAEAGGVRGTCSDCGGDTVPVVQCDGCSKRVRRMGSGWRVSVEPDVRHECAECVEGS